MKLYIDTSNGERVMIQFDEERLETKSKKDKSQKLLEFLDKKLKEKKLKLSDVSEIEVNTGPGSFTGLRVGVSVAQTLGWVLNVPVNGKDIGKGEIIDILYADSD
ncbi:tRNA (adenosine(37)-N6)-threonylcarbamoyltransferase complex dimerization subunit type 1 TsaB [Patescibacteria group bacterium]